MNSTYVRQFLIFRWVNLSEQTRVNSGERYSFRPCTEPLCIWVQIRTQHRSSCRHITHIGKRRYLHSSCEFSCQSCGRSHFIMARYADRYKPHIVRGGGITACPAHKKNKLQFCSMPRYDRASDMRLRTLLVAQSAHGIHRFGTAGGEESRCHSSCQQRKGCE